MNAFDYQLLRGLNHLADHSPFLTKVIVGMYSDQLKTGLFVALLWWVWFDTRSAADQQIVRQKMVAGLLGSILCIVVVRLMAAGLPFRPRPLSDPLNGLHFPIAPGGWGEWSAFPSDNAALFFLLTVCLFSVSRAVGWVALLDTVFLITFPRVFVGVHHPTDVLGGALIGSAVGCVLVSERVRVRLSTPFLRWMDASPSSFYASAFLTTFLFAQVFWPVTSDLIELRKAASLLLR